MNENKVRLGIVGLGQRGMSLMRDVILPQDITVAALCDHDNVELFEYDSVKEGYADIGRLDKAASLVEEAGQAPPARYTNYEEMLQDPNINTVFVSSSWDTHIPYAIQAMRAGKYCAMEVGGAYSLQDCYDLVAAYEETRIPCMIMENCCYGRDELMVLNMVRQGLFGEIVHCQGGYRHDLRDEVSYGREHHHYRFRNYLNRNCENYPTHEIGPIANVLNINRGNRMVSLVSMASKSAGLHDYLLREKGASYDASHMQFAQGDVVTTMIRCAHGETIVITLDTTLPRYYSRGFHVQGTRGMYEEDNHSIFLDATPEHPSTDREYDFKWNERWGNAKDYAKEYEHPLWKRYDEGGARGGHGGMDWVEFEDLFAAAGDWLAADEETRRTMQAPLDVYDAAAWMAITPLSEQSIQLGSAPVNIPDFTHGRWMTATPWEPYLKQ